MRGGQRTAFRSWFSPSVMNSEWPGTLGPGTLGPGQGKAVPGRAREGQDSKKVLDFVS